MTFEQTPTAIAQGPASGRLLRWFILLAIVLLIASVLLLIFGRSSFSEKDVILQLEGHPVQGYSGDEAVYKLTYQNRTGYPLNNLKFRFTYPVDSVVLRDGIPTAELVESFEVASLAPGASEVKEFRAFLVGDKGNIKEARVSVTFKAGNLASEFKKDTTTAMPIIGLPIALTLSVPPTATVGQEVTYTLDYRNETDEDISDLIITMKLPDGFAVSRTNPEFTGGPNSWSIPLFRRGAGSRITVTGILNGNERDVKNVEVVVQRKINGQFINYVKTASSTVISSPQLSVGLTANRSNDYTATLGENIRYTVSYRNNYNQSIVGLKLGVKLDGDMFDFATLKAEKGFFDGLTRTIFWNAGSIPEFASLAPAQSGVVEFEVRLKNTFPTSAYGARNYFVKATGIFSTPNVPSELDLPELVSRAELVTKISTQPTLVQLAYYNDSVFGATGPLPMQIDTETFFTIHWQVANPGNDMTGVIVRATLPPGIYWKNQASSGTNQGMPVYDKNRSEVTWNIGVVPQGVGVQMPKYEGVFRVGVTPAINQKGQTIVLAKDIVLTGTDSFTKQAFTIGTRDATTEVLADRPGEGVVR